MKKILVLCTGNSCRSQMAEAYLRKYANEKAEVYSAGVEVHGLNPRAVQTMSEDGIDISGQTSNHVDEYSDIKFDFIITVCDHANEVCPFIPGNAKRIHQNFNDPAKASGTEAEIAESFRRTRDEIKIWCREFIDKEIGN
ncbi:MAG TPA: arsenate reductase ArsC [Bacteroidia bacterium]|nr:arsenate reductase ArsC [Bacteroidia bacterium]